MASNSIGKPTDSNKKEKNNQNVWGCIRFAGEHINYERNQIKRELYYKQQVTGNRVNGKSHIKWAHTHTCTHWLDTIDWKSYRPYFSSFLFSCSTFERWTNDGDCAQFVHLDFNLHLSLSVDLRKKCFSVLRS